MKQLDEIRYKIEEVVIEYYNTKYKDNSELQEVKKIPYAGRVFDEKEILNLIDSALEFWLTSGRYTQEFEMKLKTFLGTQYCYTCNSGSSANLLAFMTLTSPLLGKKKINRGDEIITVAAGFPTTVTPILQYGAVPVFVDVMMPGYNIDYKQLESARTEKTKAVMIAHTLGNPFNLREVKAFCDKYDIWLIEDNCDALGTRYFINEKWKYTGTIGDIGTSSFYPPHHMTMGEGGAVYTDNPLLAKILLSMRDWGRDCSCPSGVDNLCKNRFRNQYGELPLGYDHKYVYSHFGYNLKITDMQAAIGCAQLDKLGVFICKRKRNWNYLRDKLECLNKWIILPEIEEGTDPSWFGFLITVKSNSPINRDKIVNILETKGVQTRMLFAGNLIKHPCFDGIRNQDGVYRQVGDLQRTNFIMNNTFWIGVYPGMTREMLDYMIATLKDIFK